MEFMDSPSIRLRSQRHLTAPWMRSAAHRQSYQTLPTVMTGCDVISPRSHRLPNRVIEMRAGRALGERLSRQRSKLGPACGSAIIINDPGPTIVGTYFNGVHNDQAIHCSLCCAITASEPWHYVPRARGTQDLRLHRAGFCRVL